MQPLGFTRGLHKTLLDFVPLQVLSETSSQYVKLFFLVREVLFIVPVWIKAYIKYQNIK